MTTGMLYTKPNEKHAGLYDVFMGDTLLGTVGGNIASLNRPTGTWSYQTVDGKTNWRAGRSRKEAALKLAKKMGVRLLSGGERPE